MKARQQMIIFFVSDQQRSKDFYQQILEKQPVLDVPGMTEFEIPGCNVLLGLMPENGIAKILGEKVAHPSKGNGIPRCELYLFLDKTEEKIQRALIAGAKEISPLQFRSWGDEVAYLSDPDGNILAIARP